MKFEESGIDLVSDWIVLELKGLIKQCLTFIKNGEKLLLNRRMKKKNPWKNSDISDGHYRLKETFHKNRKQTSSKLSLNVSIPQSTLSNIRKKWKKLLFNVFSESLIHESFPIHIKQLIFLKERASRPLKSKKMRKITYSCLIEAIDMQAN